MPLSRDIAQYGTASPYHGLDSSIMFQREWRVGKNSTIPYGYLLSFDSTLVSSLSRCAHPYRREQKQWDSVCGSGSGRRKRRAILHIYPLTLATCINISWSRIIFPLLLGLYCPALEAAILLRWSLLFRSGSTRSNALVPDLSQSIHGMYIRHSW